MAINDTRSMNTDLQAGISDGLYKSIAPDRGGVVEFTEPYTRSQILPPQYGVLDYLKGVHDYGCTCNSCS